MWKWVKPHYILIVMYGESNAWEDEKQKDNKINML